MLRWLVFAILLSGCAAVAPAPTPIHDEGLIPTVSAGGGSVLVASFHEDRWFRWAGQEVIDLGSLPGHYGLVDGAQLVTQALDEESQAVNLHHLNEIGEWTSHNITGYILRDYQHPRVLLEPTSDAAFRLIDLDCASCGIELEASRWGVAGSVEHCRLGTGLVCYVSGDESLVVREAWSGAVETWAAPGGDFVRLAANDVWVFLETSAAAVSWGESQLSHAPGSRPHLAGDWMAIGPFHGPQVLHHISGCMASLDEWHVVGGDDGFFVLSDGAGPRGPIVVYPTEVLSC